MKIGPSDRSSSSLHDRASVRGVKLGRPNRRRRGSTSVLEAPKRAIPALAKGTLILTGIAAIGVAGLWCHRYATTSPDLAIRSIEVAGGKRASKESIARLSGVEIGSNIFAADTDQIARNVAAHPWVKQAKVSRRYPNAVVIEVSEHEPAVLVALGHLYYADEQGEIVKRYTPGEKEELPVVTGLVREEMESDDGDARLRLRSAITFLRELREVLGERAPKVAEIHLDPALGLSFVPSEPDGRPGKVADTIFVGLPPWKGRLARLNAVEDALDARGVHASRLMFGGERRPDRAVARLSDSVKAIDSAQDKQAEQRRSGTAALLSLE